LQRVQIERQALVDKQGRGAQFASQQERDQWLAQEINHIQEILAQRSTHLNTLTNEQSSLRQELLETQQAAEQLKVELGQRKQQLEAVTLEAVEMRRLRDQKTEERK
jgi:structural maintenance of chromosome 3 (chondroitin sulfate proteoglycan 6)